MLTQGQRQLSQARPWRGQLPAEAFDGAFSMMHALIGVDRQLHGLDHTRHRLRPIGPCAQPWIQCGVHTLKIQMISHHSPALAALRQGQTLNQSLLVATQGRHIQLRGSTHSGGGPLATQCARSTARFEVTIEATALVAIPADKHLSVNIGLRSQGLRRPPRQRR